MFVIRAVEAGPTYLCRRGRLQPAHGVAMSSLRLGMVLAMLAAVSVSAADWPSWRGPAGTGTTPETKLPEKWSATENVAWKAPLAGLGVSSPIVSGNRVIVTSQIGSGVRAPGNHPRLVQGGNAASAGERALDAKGGGDNRTDFLVEAFNRAD